MKKLLMTLIVALIIATPIKSEAKIKPNLWKMMDDFDTAVIRYLEPDFDELVRCTEAEATDGNYEQKVNVASCIMNRVKSDKWPNTIHDVIFQKNQFSVIDDKRYYSVTIQDSTIDACKEVWKHGSAHSCYFFCTPKAAATNKYFKNKEPILKDGMHYHFK